MTRDWRDWQREQNEQRAATMRERWAENRAKWKAAILAGVHEGSKRGPDDVVWAGGKRQKALDALAAGQPVKAISKRLGINQRTLYRLQAAQRKGSPGVE